MYSITFVGLDVHKDTISVAVARGWNEVESRGIIPNNPQAIAKLVRKLGATEELSFAYEAGPCGYKIYRQITKMGAKCLVAATSLVPSRPGDRVKTDRRDAMKLARLLRAGELTPVWVPDEEHEAFRQLVRAREVAMEDARDKKHQISKFLLLNDIRPPQGTNPWTKKYIRWLESLKFTSFEQDLVLREYLYGLQLAEERRERFDQAIEEASKKSKLAHVINTVQGLRGVSSLTAATIVAEAGDITRFDSASKLMAYSGLVPSEHSSGSSIRRGGITRTGNKRLRRVLVEAAWHYRHAPRIGACLEQRQAKLPASIKEISWKAQSRLNRKFNSLIFRQKPSQVAAVAVARELLGFVWAIAHEAERLSKRKAA